MKIKVSLACSECLFTVSDVYIISLLQTAPLTIRCPETIYLIRFYLPFCPSLLSLTNNRHRVVPYWFSKGSHAFTPLCFFCICYSFYLVCLASSYSSFRAQQRIPPLILLPLQSWSLFPLCYTYFMLKLLFSRSWSLSAKQGGSWSAPTSSSSKGGCATEALCGWSS